MVRRRADYTKHLLTLLLQQLSLVSFLRQYPNGENVRLNDVLLLHDGQRVVVVDIDAATTSVKVAILKGGSTTAFSAVTETAAIIGNIYAQGNRTSLLEFFYQTGLSREPTHTSSLKRCTRLNGSQGYQHRMVERKRTVHVVLEERNGCS